MRSGVHQNYVSVGTAFGEWKHFIGSNVICCSLFRAQAQTLGVILRAKVRAGTNKIDRHGVHPPYLFSLLPKRLKSRLF